MYSIEIFSTWNEVYGVEIEWEEGGYAFVAYREREEKILKDLLVTQKSFGLDIDWYDHDDFLKIIPDLNPDHLIGGTFSPHDGSASPLLATHAFYTHAQSAGSVFHFNEPVTSMVVEKGKVTQVITSKDSYSCGVVINAAGPWAAEIGAMTGLDLPVKPDSHEAAITEAVAQFLKPMVVDIRPTEGSTNYYFYQHLTGQIIFCITPSPSIWGFDVRETSDFLPMVAQRMLEKQQLLVETAANGAIAVQMFSSSTSDYYDAILMDIRMPVLDGHGAAKQIRTLARPDARTVPIIAMTADAFDGDVRASLQSGMNAHLNKPIEPEVLYRTLAKFLNTEK